MKRTKFLGIIALVAVMGFALIGCDNNGDDPAAGSLIGTWDGIGASAGETLIFSGNNIFFYYFGIPLARGTFVIPSANTITTTFTHFHSSFFGSGSGWLDRGQIRLLLIVDGMTPADADIELNELFAPHTATFSVIGSTLTITDEWGTGTYSRRP